MGYWIFGKGKGGKNWRLVYRDLDLPEAKKTATRLRKDGYRVKRVKI